METTLLAGPSQFTLEAWNYLWRHKWFLCALSTLPWLMETYAEYWLGMHNFNEDFFLSPINILLQPFWAIVWLRTLLMPSQQSPSESYFKLNVNYIWYIMYGLALSIPFIGINYWLKVFHIHLGVIFLLYTIWTLVTAAFLLIFPALAINRNMFFKDILRVTQLFWKDFLKSILIGLFLTMLILSILFLLCSSIINLLQLSIPPFLAVAADNLFGIWANAFLLTITGIYYKRYLMEIN